MNLKFWNSLFAIFLIVNLQAGQGFLEGSKESLSSLTEEPNFENQINRIIYGIDFIRINSDLLNRMPISEDAVWIDKITQERKLKNIPELKYDPFFYTNGFTAMVLKTKPIEPSDIVKNLYFQVKILYLKIPNMYQMPSFTDIKSYIEFKNSKLNRQVKAIHGNLFNTLEEAVISLTSDQKQEEIIEAKSEYQDVFDEVAKLKIKIEKLETWLDDDVNQNNSKKNSKKAELEVAQKELEQKEQELETKEEIFFKLLDDSAKDLENNVDLSKAKLAEKTQKVLELIKNNAILASSLFGAATTGLIRGRGRIADEFSAISQAKTIVKLSANSWQEKQKLIKMLENREERLKNGSMYAMPILGVGSFYAIKQISLVNKYLKITEVITKAKAINAK